MPDTQAYSPTSLELTVLSNDIVQPEPDASETDLLWWSVKHGIESTFRLLMGPIAAKLEFSFEKRKALSIKTGDLEGTQLEVRALYHLITHIINQTEFAAFRDVLVINDANFDNFKTAYRTRLEQISPAQPVHQEFMKRRPRSGHFKKFRGQTGNAKTLC